MSLECPRCRDIQLEEIEVREVVVDRCPRCAGIWFDNAEIGAFLGRQSKTGAVDSIIPENAVDEPSFCCPKCQDNVALRKFEYGSAAAPATFFRCISCIGTWLDRGELRRVEDPRLEQVLQDFFATIDPAE